MKFTFRAFNGETKEITKVGPDHLISFVDIQRNENRCETTMTAKTTTSEYLLLFRGTNWPRDLSPEEIQNNIAKFTLWFERLKNDGNFKSGHPLEHDGKIVAGRNTVVDGPFSESKEAVAGFFIIQADSLEKAVEIAKNCPGLDYGQTVEVRAIASEAAELQVARQKKAG